MKGNNGGTRVRRIVHPLSMTVETVRGPGRSRRVSSICRTFSFVLSRWEGLKLVVRVRIRGCPVWSGRPLSLDGEMSGGGDGGS